MARIDGPLRPGLTARLAWGGIRRRLGKVSDTWRIAAHAPWLLRGWGAFEMALDRSRHVDAQLKELAQIKTAVLVGCEACIDVHSHLGRQTGVTEEQLHGLTDHATSPAFSSLEKLVLDYVVAVTRTPVDVPDELFAALRRLLSEAQLVELTAVIVQENFRARFNRAFRVPAVGFSEGGFCPLPGRGP